jgi:MFS family permease
MAKIINRVIKILITSDFFLNLGWGLLSPIFAIFILQNITVDPLKATEIAGFAALFYWVTKSIVQIPIGNYLDKNDGEKDDFWFMVIGTVIVGFIPIGYLFSTEPWHIYVFQVIHAVGMAMALPSWLAIFTRHIDKGKEGYEWSLESTSIGAGAGIAGGIGGIMASVLGFKLLLISVSLLTFASAILLLLVKNNLMARDKNIFIAPIKTVIEP